MNMSIGRNTVSGQLLQAFVDRIERCRQIKKDAGNDESAILAEAKAGGFSPAAIRAVVKIRTLKPHDRQEAEALLDMYLHSLGMAAEPPLFRAAGLAAIDTAVREQVLAAMHPFVPTHGSGSITVAMGSVPVKLSRNKAGEVEMQEVIEPPPAPAARSSSVRQPKPPQDVPDCTAAEAEDLGRAFARDNRPVIDNPFPFGDPRRARFDKGWRDETGNDGFGPGEE